MAEAVVRPAGVVVLVALGFFGAWVAVDYGIVRLFVGLVHWLLG